MPRLSPFSVFLLMGSVLAHACGGTLSSSPSAPDGGPAEQTDARRDSPPNESGPILEAGPSGEDAPNLCPGASGRVPQNHRAQATACPAQRGAGDAFTPGSADECTSDATCVASPNGRCLFYGGSGHCSYDACASDADCSGGTVCDCRPSGTSNHPNVCLQANCRTDADCGTSGYCSKSDIPGAIPPWEPNSPGFTTMFQTGYFCHAPNDCCIDNADCAPNGTHYDYCLYAGQNRAPWQCGGGP
jgi:hypothetical protein